MAADEASFEIRAARPGDKGAVRALCARVWADDYISDVFDDWVRDRTGRLWVAVERGRMIGVAKLTVHSSGDALLHDLPIGLRPQVHHFLRVFVNYSAGIGERAITGRPIQERLP